MDSDNLRVRMWNHLCNVKFKANYCHSCSHLAERCGNMYSVVLALGTSASVAAWAIWQRFPFFWGLVVVSMQVLQIVRPYIPLLRHDKSYAKMAFKFEELYLNCEKLWSRFEDGEISAELTATAYYDAREKEVEIEQKGVRTPRLSYLIRKAERETLDDLRRNLPKETDHD